MQTFIFYHFISFTAECLAIKRQLQDGSCGGGSAERVGDGAPGTRAMGGGCGTLSCNVKRSGDVE
jgi:hypothetical protein